MEVVLSLIPLSFLNLFLTSLSSKTSFIWSEFLFWSLIWDFGLEVSLGVGGVKFSSLLSLELSLSLSLSFYLFIYLFLAALGLHCCTRAFSSCSEQGLLSSCYAWVSPCASFSCGAWALGLASFSNCDERAPRHMGSEVSFQTRV